MSTTSERLDAARGGRSVAIVPLGLSLSVFLALTFLLCALGALIPGVRDIHLLQVLAPWLDWSRPAEIVLGAAGAFVWGWYIAIGWGSLYNLFAARRPSARA